MKEKLSRSILLVLLATINVWQVGHNAKIEHQRDELLKLAKDQDRVNKDQNALLEKATNLVETNRSLYFFEGWDDGFNACGDVIHFYIVHHEDPDVRAKTEAFHNALRSQAMTNYDTVH